MSDTLLNKLVHRINTTGPISVAEFMAESLIHKIHGYYTHGDPFGTKGDFTTAPEISQIFGELLGLWMVTVLNGYKTNYPICLVELGPGRGTLMSDMLRTMSKFIDVDTMLEIHLVETNKDLRTLQSKVLEKNNTTWHEDLSSLPNKPWFLIANEFLDALPIHQIVKFDGKWVERLISQAKQSHNLTWTIGRMPSQLGLLVPEDVNALAGDNALLELSPAVLGILKSIAENITAYGGAALIIDYGYTQPTFTSSLQAIRKHQFVDPLEQPGDADISSHIDFSLIKRESNFYDLNFYGPVTQREFLTRMGINERALALQKNKGLEASKNIQTAVNRLITADDMGNLFKVIALTSHNIIRPPGF
ncbi:MAG: methyltransferase [Rhodospirillaceae bacterium]|nr:methyltransferase [Rhodospirillaceae bacterium]|tara:strand:+ start:829 stop:1914 length:1086 start_codon:yes stop_codon:yes gene_type:complete